MLACSNGSDFEILQISRFDFSSDFVSALSSIKAYSVPEAH
jgi:hypothetical protein